MIKRISRIIQTNAIAKGVDEMLGKIGLYFLVLMIGIVIGQRDLLGKKIYPKLEKAQSLAVIGLIFIMGIKIGLDREVMGALPTIGLSAFFMAICSILGSIIFVRLMRKVLLERRGAKRLS